MILLQIQQFINNTTQEHLFNKCSTKLVLLKTSKISLKNTSAWTWMFGFMPSACIYIMKETPVQLFSSEFFRIFKKIFLFEHPWASASDFIFEMLKLNKYMKVSLLFNFLFWKSNIFIFFYVFFVLTWRAEALYKYM